MPASDAACTAQTMARTRKRGREPATSNATKGVAKDRYRNSIGVLSKTNPSASSPNGGAIAAAAIDGLPPQRRKTETASATRPMVRIAPTTVCVFAGIYRGKPPIRLAAL